jgi:Flp pilus assembly protein TadG
MRRLFRRHREADRGQALVEFGLVLPLLLLLIFGLVDLGRAVYAQNALS